MLVHRLLYNCRSKLPFVTRKTLNASKRPLLSIRYMSSAELPSPVSTSQQPAKEDQDFLSQVRDILKKERYEQTSKQLASSGKNNNPASSAKLEALETLCELQFEPRAALSVVLNKVDWLLENHAETLNLWHFNIILRALSSHGELQRCMYTATLMESMGLDANSMTYSLVIRSCTVEGRWDVAEQTLHMMREHGLDPNLQIVNSVMAAYAKAHKYMKASEMIRSLSHIGLVPDVVSFNTVISSCGIPKGKEHDQDRQHRIEIVDEMLQLMDSMNISPNTLTYNTAISCCRFETEKALHYWEQMHRAGLEPDYNAYTQILSFFANQPQTVKSKYKKSNQQDIVKIFANILQEMIDNGMNPSWKIWHKYSSILTYSGRLSEAREVLSGYTDSDIMGIDEEVNDSNKLVSTTPSSILHRDEHMSYGDACVRVVEQATSRGMYSEILDSVEHFKNIMKSVQKSSNEKIEDFDKSRIELNFPLMEMYKIIAYSKQSPPEWETILHTWGNLYHSTAGSDLLKFIAHQPSKRDQFKELFICGDARKDNDNNNKVRILHTWNYELQRAKKYVNLSRGVVEKALARVKRTSPLWTRNNLGLDIKSNRKNTQKSELNSRSNVNSDTSSQFSKVSSTQAENLLNARKALANFVLNDFSSAEFFNVNNSSSININPQNNSSSININPQNKNLLMDDISSLRSEVNDLRNRTSKMNQRTTTLEKQSVSSRNLDKKNEETRRHSQETREIVEKKLRLYREQLASIVRSTQPISSEYRHSSTVVSTKPNMKTIVNTENPSPSTTVSRMTTRLSKLATVLKENEERKGNVSVSINADTPKSKEETKQVSKDSGNGHHVDLLEKLKK